MADPATGNENLTDLLNDDDELLEDALEEDANRPRFAGKKRQWLKYTEEARDASISLDRIEDADLASHLYNAHRLKRRRLDGLSIGSNVKPYFRKERWGTELEESNGIGHKSSWTSWPLQPDRLPSADVAPGSRLDNGTEDRLNSKPDGRLKPSSDLEDCLLSEILRQARETFCARKDYGEASSGEHDNQQARNDTVEAVIMADEEQARSISQPVIRHIIARFEKLLRALHASRQGHIRLRDSKHAEAAADETSGEETSRSRSHSVSFHGSSFAARVRAAPRDWSEVLGIAAMIGWKPEALRKTYLRCTELFDESMDFVSLAPGAQKDILPLNMSSPIVTTDPPQASLASAVRATAIDDLCCPYEECSRHYQPYPNRWRLTEHLKRKHGEQAQYRGQQLVLPEDEIYGGVHLDGFLQPIDLPRQPKRRRASMKSNPVSATSASESDESTHVGASSASRLTRFKAMARGPSEGTTFADRSSAASEVYEADGGNSTDTPDGEDVNSDESRSDT